MSDLAPPPPPRKRQGRPAQSVTEWPATSDELDGLRREFEKFRQGLVGSRDFPGGELQVIKGMVIAAESHRAADVAELHKRLGEQNVLIAQLPDVVVAKINGTYVKTSAFGKAVDDRIANAQGVGRLAKLSAGWKTFAQIATWVVVGVVTYFLTNVLPHR